VDEFDPAGIQLAYVITMYTERLTTLYGGYDGWIRQVGRPLINLFMSEREIEEFWNGGWQRARAIFFWAGLQVPETSLVGNVSGSSRPKVLKWDMKTILIHVLAIQEAYEHPEYW
jgi:hypothetical protein